MRSMSILAILLSLFVAASVSADTIRVPADQPTIQAGINAALDGDTVLVADGTYTGEGNRDIDFLGKAITVASENGPENCVIDAYLSHERVFVFDSGEDHDSVLEGFTITGGEGEYEYWGGGIYCEGSSPTIRGNIITGNKSWFGSGICCWTGSQPIIEGNVITANQMQYSMKTGSWGGGIFVYQSDLVLIRDNVISWNIADMWSMGCAVYAQESNIEMINNLVIHNGVGKEPYESLRFNDCHVLLRNLTLAENEIIQRGALGLIGSTIIIEDSIISNDFDPQIYLHESDCTVRYSNVRDGWTGEGNIDADSLFVAGPLGGHYLSQTAAGQTVDSPCVDAGDPASTIPEGTTRIDHVEDTNIVDMGYHYPLEVPIRLVISPGPGYDNPPLVRVFPPWQDAEFQYEFKAYDPDHYGVNVSAGDVTGDGRDEILTGAGPGEIYGPHVRGFQVGGTPLPGLSFFAWPYPNVRYGATVFAGADLDGDGRDDLVVGGGPDPEVGTPVKAYRYDGTQVTEWFSLESYDGMTHGTNVAAGNF